MTRPLELEGLTGLIDRVAPLPHALIGIGMPRCPASLLLVVSLAEIHRLRPNLPVGLTFLRTPEEWGQREQVLWPRGIRVSRSSVPVVVLMRDGHAVAVKPGGGPAHVLERWLEPHLGPPTHPAPMETTDAEREALAGIAERRAQQQLVKSPERSGRPD